MNEVRKAEIFNSMIEEGYTCMINFHVLNSEGRRSFIQGFGGKKFHTIKDYETWKIGIENITGRRFEDINGAIIKIILTEDEDILGIGSFNENYWIVKEQAEGKTEFSFKTNREKTDEFFEKNNIKHSIEVNKKDDNSLEK